MMTGAEDGWRKRCPAVKEIGSNDTATHLDVPSDDGAARARALVRRAHAFLAAIGLLGLRERHGQGRCYSQRRQAGSRAAIRSVLRSKFDVPLGAAHGFARPRLRRRWLRRESPALRRSHSTRTIISTWAHRRTARFTKSRPTDRKTSSSIPKRNISGRSRSMRKELCSSAPGTKAKFSP